MEKKFIIGFIIGIAALVVLVVFINNKSNGPVSNVDLVPFAQCLKDKGIIFYGAFWCPHCQATKKMFGDAKNTLPYVECSTADGQGQLQMCTDKGIKSYPTWRFPDGTELTGEKTLEELSDKSGCLLPDSLQSSTTSPASTASSSAASPAL
jgi:hypothetical protein